MKKITFITVILLWGCVQSPVPETELKPENYITYSGDSLRNIAVPLGGIGTGDILIGGRGNIQAFEIFNRAANDGNLPYMSFFSLW